MTQQVSNTCWVFFMPHFSIYYLCCKNEVKVAVDGVFIFLCAIKSIVKMHKTETNSSYEAISRCAFIALFAGQQHPNLGIPTLMRQHPRPADQGRVVPHMLVVPTSQLGHPMVFFVLEVACYGLLHYAIKMIVILEG